MTEIRFKKYEEKCKSFVNKCKKKINDINILEFECLMYEEDEIKTRTIDEATAYNKVKLMEDSIKTILLMLL